jgi:3-carboxy-cis,cis-muconate cycloisomerase
MTFSPFDSPIYSTLYGDAEVRALFTDSAEVRAMLLVEGTLAKVQGELGVIPLDSALYIHRASMEVQVDPAGLATGMAETGSPIPAMVAAFGKAMEAPDHAKYIHWGARSQDILDTALVLRLRQYVRLLDTRLEALTKNSKFVDLALLRQKLNTIKGKLLVVRFIGDDSISKTKAVESDLAKALKLSIPTDLPISAREVIVELVSVISQIATSLAEIAKDFPTSIHSEVLETMAVFTVNQLGQIRPAHSQDNVVLALEKLALAQICIAGSVALKHAQTMADQT